MKKILITAIASVTVLSLTGLALADEFQDSFVEEVIYEEVPAYAANAPASGEYYFGMINDGVAQLQQCLADLGYQVGAIDGYFGSLTENAVVMFQMEHGLVTDGVAGPITLAALNGAPAVSPAPETPSADAGQSTDAVLSTSVTLSIGSYGDNVLALQNILKSLGYYTGGPDGDFGPVTQNAVIAYQSDHGLVADGIAGPITLGSLASLGGSAQPAPQEPAAPSTPAAPSNTQFAPAGTLFRGSQGSDVIALQNILNALGFNAGNPDGDFGAFTERAVIAFQSAYGLDADGIVGPITIAALSGLSTGDPDDTPSAGNVLDPVYSAGWQIGENSWRYVDYEGNVLTQGTGSLSNDQKSTITAVYQTSAAPAGYCSSWVTNVLANAGVMRYNLGDLRPSIYSYAEEAGLITDDIYAGDCDFNANDYWAYVCSSSDPADLKEGMIVATRNSYSHLGQQFGHVGIYVGNDTVVSSVGDYATGYGYLETLPLARWNANYNNTEVGSSIKWGFIPGNN